MSMSILASIAGGAAFGVFGLIGDYFNRKEMRRQQEEGRSMANKQFAWGQEMDRFGMNMMNRQQDETEKMNRHQITQNHVDRLNEMLKTNIGLQNHVRSLWGGK